MCELGRDSKSRFGSRVQIAIIHRTDRIAAILDVDFRDQQLGLIDNFWRVLTWF